MHIDTLRIANKLETAEVQIFIIIKEYETDYYLFLGINISTLSRPDSRELRIYPSIKKSENNSTYVLVHLVQVLITNVLSDLIFLRTTQEKPRSTYTTEDLNGALQPSTITLIKTQNQALLS